MAVLIGRAPERRQLRELVSSRVPVAVPGPAGIGKTLLVRAAFRGQPSVTGTALAPLQWSRYLPLAQAIRASLTGDPDEVAAAVLAAADRRVLVVEDLQWADAGTTAVLEVLAQRLPIVVTVRTGAGGERSNTAPCRRGPTARPAPRWLVLMLRPTLGTPFTRIASRREPAGRRAEVAVRAGDATAQRRAQTARKVAADLALKCVLARADRTLAATLTPATTLSPREQEVLGLVAAGLTSRAIADELGIGAATVDSHLRSARQKLGARTRWQAATAFASLPHRPSTT